MKRSNSEQSLLSKGRFFLQAGLPLFVLGLASVLSLAQGDKVTVVGTITDSTGAVVPGTEVSLIRLATNESLTAVTSDTGDFVFTAVVPDVYDFGVSLTGFKSYKRAGQKLDVGQTYRMDAQLEVGEVSETIQVMAATPILKTEGPELGQVIHNEKVDSLPLNDRDVFGAFGALVPGVQPTRENITGAGLSFNVKGQRLSDNLAMIDGSMVSELNGAVSFFINPDSVQEFEVKTGLYGAEYGVKSGGQFSLVTKSGTNDLHGTLFWFHRNDNLDARNFFDPGPRPEFKRNQFGAVAGGPLYLPGLFQGKDKAWWFGSYSGQRIRRFLSLTGNVPTAEERAGRFSQTILDPLTGEDFPNNTIPPERFNPVALKLLAFYPDPNTDPSRGFNHTSTSSREDDTNQYLVKMDFKTSENSRWSGRFMYEERAFQNAGQIEIFGSDAKLTQWLQNITNTRTIKDNIINEFGFHFYRRPYNPGTPWIPARSGFGQSLGIRNWPRAGIDFDGVPQIFMSGMKAIGDGVFGTVPTGNWEIKDNVSLIRGSHFIKLGYHYRYQYILFGQNLRTSFIFRNNRYTHNGFANFLLGYATQAREGGELRTNQGQGGHFFYFQDSWRVSPKLTLNLGLRYELRRPWRDKRGFLTNLEYDCASQTTSPVPDCYDPAVAISDPVFPSTGRYAADQPLFRWSKNGWQPRLGVSYRLMPNTVIRAGGGIYGNDLPGGMAYTLGGPFNPRANAERRFFLSSSSEPNLSLSDPFGPTTPRTLPPTVQGIKDPLPQWYVPNWGLSVQHRLGQNSLLEVGYQGSRSVHEVQVISENDATPGPGDLQPRRPFPSLQEYRFLRANGDRNYHALEVKFEKRPGPKGLSTLLAYTWAKSLDTIGGRIFVRADEGFISRNVTNRDNRGRGEANIPGRLAGMVGYDLPFGTIGAGNVLRNIIGGWSFYGILTLQKGQWAEPRMSGDFAGAGSRFSQRPQFSGDPNLPPDQRRPERWFNPDVFSIPPEFQYGNAGRGTLEGPGTINFDLSVIRSFRTSENSRLEFRFDAFNLTNHTNFGLADGRFPSPLFGVSSNALEARDLQFGLKFHF